MTNTKKITKKVEAEMLPPSSLEEANLAEQKEDEVNFAEGEREGALGQEKGLLDTLGEKKKESEELDQAGVDLAEENNVEIEADLLPKGEKFLAAIGYLSFLCILPLVLKPDSKFCQFHGKQGLVILVFWIVFGFFAEMIMPFSYATWLLMKLLYVGLACYGVYLGFTGQKKEIPVVGKIAATLTW